MDFSYRIHTIIIRIYKHSFLFVIFIFQLWLRNTAVEKPEWNNYQENTCENNDQYIYWKSLISLNDFWISIIDEQGSNTKSQ